MNTTVAAVDGPGRPVRAKRPPHMNPELASWTQSRWYRVLLMDLLITVTGAAADAVMASTVLTLVLASAGLDWMAVPTAFSLIAVACAAAFTAGRALHHSTTGSGKAWGAVLLGLWALLGAGLVALRALHSQIARPDTGDATDPTDIQQIIDRAHAADLGIAAVMALVYACTGLLLVHAAKDLANPALLRMLAGRRALEAVEPKWIRARSHTVKHGLLLHRRAEHIHRWLPHELGLELDTAAAGGELAKEVSRVGQAEIIGKPRATLMTLLDHFSRQHPGHGGGEGAA